MKFTCEKALLSAAIASASRVVPSRSNLTALEGILIEAGQRLRLTGFNLEVGIRTELDADIRTQGSAVVGARLLSDIVRRLPDDVISFSLDDKMILHIECGQIVFDISSCLDGSTYPEMPYVKETNKAVLPQKMLRDMIHGTLFAVSDNETKVIHTGSKFFWEDGLLTIVSVDGYRLALRRKEYEGTGLASDFVVPGTALREVERLLSDSDEETVSIMLGARHILFAMGGTTLITRLLEGDFLNYKNTIPQEYPLSVTLDVEAFMAGIDRVSLLVNEKIKNPVRIGFAADRINMSCVTSLGHAKDVCAATVEGALPDEGFEIGFNHRYLLDALHALPDHNCVFQLINPLSPCVITPQEGDEYLYMILPVRLRNE